MMESRRKLGFLAVAFLGALLSSSGVRAASWPPDPMNVVVANSLGGGEDVITRALGSPWQKMLGTHFAYQVHSGASGRIGYDFFLKEVSEGQLPLLSSNIATAGIMYAHQKPSWNWRKSFAPVGIMSVDPGVLFVSGTSKYRTLKQLLDAAKQHRMRLVLGNWASPDNMLMQQIIAATGAKIEVIPVIKVVRIVSDVLAGNAEIGYTKLSTLHRVGGNLRYLAVSLAKNPAPQLTQNAPTIDHVLGKKTLSVASYRVILASQRFKNAHPKDFAKLQRTFLAAKRDPGFLSKAKRLGFDPALMGNESSAEINDTLQRYWSAYAKYASLFKAKR